jgi:predicted AAA+ superfamily ATPase
VDLLLVHGRRVVPIEIKLGAAVDPRQLVGLRQVLTDLRLKRGFVITTGNERRSVGPIEILPWSEIAEGGIDLPL